MAISPPNAFQDYRFLGTFRFLLAWLVMTSHASHYLPAWVAPLALGNVGVFCFFALSGFVIAEACDRFYRAAPLRFFANRLLRIYPVYWLACATAVAVYLVVGHPQLALDARELSANLSILYSPTGVFFWISIIWAVNIELRFYFVAALLNAALKYARRYRRWVYALFVAGALGLYATTVLLDYQRFATFRHAPYFVFGVALYHALIGRSAPASIVAACTLPVAVHAYLEYNAPGLSPFSSTAVFIIMLGVMAVLARVEPSRRIARTDKRLGDFTYPLYLVHWPIVYLVDRSSAFAGYAAYAAIALASFAAATLVLVLEKPLVRLRDGVRRRPLYV